MKEYHKEVILGRRKNYIEKYANKRKIGREKKKPETNEDQKTKKREVFK
jgi:hypothetical protein